MPNTNFTFFLDNLISRKFTTVMGIKEHVLFNSVTDDLPGSRLKNDEPREVARLLSLCPGVCGWRFSFYLMSFIVDGFGIINPSLSRNGKWRIIGKDFSVDEDPTLLDAPVAYYTPTSTISSTNITGDHTDIAEPIYSPNDIEYVGPSVAGNNWTARFALPVSGPAITGLYSFCVTLYVKMFDVTGALLSENPYEYPKIEIEIFEAGVSVLDLGHKAITSMDGQYIFFDFDGGVLADKTDLEIEIRAFTGLNNNSELNSRLITLAVAVETSTLIYDTGWQLNTGRDWTSDYDGITTDITIPHLLDTSWSVSSLCLLYRDDQLELNPLSNVSLPIGDPPFNGVPAGLVPKVPETFIDTGIFVVSKAIRLTYGIPASKDFSSLKPVSVESNNTGMLGESYAADSFKIREGKPVELLVTHSEGLTLLHRIGLARGTQGPFMVAYDPNLGKKYQPFIAEWVVATEVSELVRFPQQYNPEEEMLQMISLRFRQRL